MPKRQEQIGYMRYILCTPTEIYGHYKKRYFSNLREAKEKLVPGGHILDILTDCGYGSKIVASMRERT